MKTLLAITFGMHLLLGNIVLGGIPLEASLTVPVVLETEAMSMVMTPVSRAVSVQGEESASCESATQGGCPTEHCVAHGDAEGAPLETLSLVRPLSDQDVIALSSMQHVSAPKELVSIGAQKQSHKALAFHFSSVILRE